MERNKILFTLINYKLTSNILHTVHVVPRCRSPNPCLPQQQELYHML